MGSNGTIFILEDGKFVLVGYGTFILGNYDTSNEGMTFTPFIPDHSFTILGRQNKEIKKGVKLTFERTFYDNGTGIRFDEDLYMPVFAEDFVGGSHIIRSGLKTIPVTSLSCKMKQIREILSMQTGLK